MRTNIHVGQRESRVSVNSMMRLAALATLNVWPGEFAVRCCTDPGVPPASVDEVASQRNDFVRNRGVFLENVLIIAHK